MRDVARVIFVAAGLASAAPVFAADLAPPPAPAAPPPVLMPSDWRFEVTLYGWATNLTGNVGVGQFPTSPFFASFGDILDHFQGAFMGAVVARNETFIGGLDVIWSRVGTVVTFDDPSRALFGGGANIKLTSAIVTGFGGLRIPIGSPNLQLYGVLGARYFSETASLTLQGPVGAFPISASATKDWVDPIVGLFANYRIDDKWFVNAAADIGGLGDSATGQGLGAVGYNWTPSISTTLGYRVLYAYERQNNAANGSFRIQQWMYGPFAAIKYSF
jgi:hypothetical protein